MSAHNLPYELSLAPFEAGDPGTGKAISVDRWNQIVPFTIVAATAETNTLAVPTRAGQRLTLVAKTVGGGGSRAVTVASAINATGNTVATFDAANETLVLESVPSGTTYRWLAAARDGATLS